MFIVKYLEDKEKQNVKRNPWDPEIAHILVSSFNLLTLTPPLTKKPPLLPTLKLSYSLQAKKTKACLLELRKQYFCAFESEVKNKEDSIHWNARTQPATQNSI